MPAKKRELTVPDLVLLSLLAEQPMHGYQANTELERRQVQDWAGISRPLTVKNRFSIRLSSRILKAGLNLGRISA